MNLVSTYCSLRESLLRASPSLQWSCSSLGVLMSFSFHASNTKTEESIYTTQRWAPPKVVGQTQTTAFLGATNHIVVFCWVLVFIRKKQISTWKVRLKVYLKTVRLNRGKDATKNNLHFSESEYEHVISKCCAVWQNLGLLMPRCDISALFPGQVITF